MAKKKVKIDASPTALAATIPLAEDVRQGNDATETSVLETTTPIADPVTTIEPVAEKPARTAKKATQSKAIELVAKEAPPVAKKAAKAKEHVSEKAVKMKRLTLDIPKPLHKAIKAQAVEEGISIVEMLRTLLEQHYGK